MKSKSSLLPIFATLVLASTFMAGCQSDSTERAFFLAARQNVHAGAFAEAIKEFQAFDSRFPKSQFASRSSFLIAKCQLGLGDFELSKQAFDKTIAGFPDSLEAKKSAYKLAEIDLLQGKIESATEKLTAITNGLDNPYMPEAVSRLKTLEAKNP